MSLDIRPNPSVTGSVTGSLVYKGSYNATTNSPDLTSSQKGDFYIVSVGGTLAGVTLNVGDHIVFNQNASSPITSAMFDVIDNTDAVASVNTQTGVVVLDTDDISEGSTNLYYTDTRADARIGAADLTDLNDVNYTAGAGIDNYVLTYNHANTRWEAEAPGASTDTLDTVVGRGATTATAIQTGGLTVTGDIDPDATATYSIGDEDNRFISYYGDMNGAIRFKAKVDQTGGLDAGEVVYIKGVSGTVPTVGKAQANSSSTMPAFGLVFADANDTADVEIITFGNLTGLDTSTLTLNSTLYVSSTTAGGLVESAPSGESNLIQNIGFVVRSDNGSGIIKVGGAGRTNATPNLDQNKIFLGNASNQAVSTALSSINLSSLNNDLDTDDISEGTTNLYFTNTRADGRISAANLTDLNDVNYTAGAGIDNYVLTYNHANTRWEAEAPASAPVSSVNTQTGAVVLDTDDISEGTTNLYYTNARFDTQLGTKDTDDLSEGTTNLYFTNARFDTQLGTKDTGDLSEGSNLYYTNARADARIGAANLTDLNDVNYTAGAGIDNYVLTYNHANTRWEAELPATAPVTSVNTQTGAVVLDTDDISEGSTNLYYTNARFDTQLGTKDTDDLSEGTTNLYFTNTRADGRISAANLTDLNDVNYTAGSGIDNYVLTYNHANTRWEAEQSSISPPTITSASPSTDYTISTHAGNEEIYILTPSADITVNLPAASTCGSGYKYQIKNMASANTLTIDPNSTETIDTQSTYVISNQYESITIVTNGTNWFII